MSGRPEQAGEGRVRAAAVTRAKKRKATIAAGQTANHATPADRRAHIIKMATARIAKFGYEVTTVRQIADDVNILSGSLYHHFATKDEILYEVVKDAVAHLRNETVRISSAEADPETKLVSLIMLELGELVQNHQVHAILYNERKLLRTHEEFAEVRKAKQDVYQTWRGILNAGMENGQFDKQLDLYQTIRTITRMLNSAADWYASGDETLATVVERYTFEQVQAFYLRFILGAVRDPSRAMEPVPIDGAALIAWPASEK